MIQGTEHLLYKNRQRELMLFGLEKVLRRSDSLSVYKVGYKKQGDRFLSKVCCDRTRGNGLKKKECRFSVDIRKKNAIRIVEALNKLLKEVVDTLSLGTLSCQTSQNTEQPDPAVSLSGIWERLP